jgi:hypothetical protein
MIGRRMRLGVVAALLAVVALTCPLAVTASSSLTVSVSRSSARSVCVKVVTIDSGRLPSPSDPRVRKCQRVMAALDLKCKESRIRRADMAVVSRRLLREAGISESVLSILTHVNQSIPRGFGRMPCAGIFAAYVTLRTGG